MTSTVNPALCIDRGGVPHIEADMACDILCNVQQQQRNSKATKDFYFCGSYFDALSLVKPCTITKRDALTEMGIRSYDISSRRQFNKTVTASTSKINFNHILLPRSPLYPVAGGLPTAEAGPSQDLIQGRVVMTIEKFKEVISATKPDFTTPLCELIAVQEVLNLANRKKQSLTSRNEKWMKETMNFLASSSSTCVFPLGTHFNYVNNNNNKQNSKEDGAEQTTEESTTTNNNTLATNVGINEALYEQWCGLFTSSNEDSASSSSSSSSKRRILSLLSLNSGETPEQRQQFLKDIFTALEAVETKMVSKSPQQQLPPLQLLVGNIANKSMLKEIQDVFFSSSSLKFNTEIICISTSAPSTLAANGMALQQNKNVSSSTSAQQDQKQEDEVTKRRDRDDDQTISVQSDEKVKKQNQKASPQEGFNVINLWDTEFKFSRDPLCTAQTTTNNKSEKPQFENLPCPCYTCERHTAGYFHHLLDVHEMNAEILLSVHNYTEWFSYLMN